MAGYDNTGPQKEIMQGKRALYSDIVRKLVEEVYESGDFNKIGRFERDVVLLGERYCKSDLEDDVENDGAKNARVADRRQRLTHYRYAKAKEAGMTNEQIRERYRMDSPQQLGGFARTYALRKRIMGERK